MARRSGPLLLAAAAALLALPARAVQWDPIPPALLHAREGRVDPGAPVEAVFHRIEIDDSRFPESRHFHEYFRYQIFDPAKAANATRVEAPSTVEISARLTLPDGAVRDFGRDALKERSVVRSARETSWLQRLLGATGLDVKERFLAVSGVVPSAILDVQYTYDAYNLGYPWLLKMGLQRTDTPIEHLEVFYQATHNPYWQMRTFTLNGNLAHATSFPDDKHRTVRIEARDLPALVGEPFSGPPADYELTFIAAYHPEETTMVPRHPVGRSFSFDVRKEPWSGYATTMYMIELDRAIPTLQTRATAAALTAGASSAEAKAERIHRFVSELYQRYRHAPHLGTAKEALSLNDVLHFDQNSALVLNAWDFIGLEVQLCRDAGLEAHTVMLPNRDDARFAPNLVADAFLPLLAVRVRTENGWRLSYPVYDAPFPFGVVPWQAQGLVGLVAEPSKQEFFPVPLQPAEDSTTTNAGDFELTADGSLTGHVHLTLTGQSAAVVREKLLVRDPQRRISFLRGRIKLELHAPEIHVSEISGVDDPDVPLRIAYRVVWPDYAVTTRSRIIFRPGVFHSGQSSPFSTEARHYPFDFPYRWKEVDQVTLTIPAGYEVETKQAPSSMPGTVLDYRCSIAQEKATNKIHYSRSFSSSVISAPVTAAGPLKRWYDAMAARDQFELVLVNQQPVKAAAPDDAP